MPHSAQYTSESSSRHEHVVDGVLEQHVQWSDGGRGNGNGGFTIHTSKEKSCSTRTMIILGASIIV